MTKPRRTEQNWNFTLLLLFFRFSSVSVEGHKRVALQLVTGSQYWSRGLSPLRDSKKKLVNNIENNNNDDQIRRDSE